MARRVIILQRDERRTAALVPLLRERDFGVQVFRSDVEARPALRDHPGVILIDAPPARECDHLVCGWVRDTVRPVPAMIGVLADGQDADAVAACHDCMTLLPADASPHAIADAIEDAARWWPGDV